jgi:hypothetical protein
MQQRTLDRVMDLGEDRPKLTILVRSVKEVSIRAIGARSRVGAVGHRLDLQHSRLGSG